MHRRCAAYYYTYLTFRVQCASVCWTQQWAVPKRLNRSRCHLKCGLGWALGAMRYRWGSTGVAREVRGRGPHRAALSRGGERAKIVFKNSRENSDCIISYVFACNKNKALQLQREPILSILGYNIDLYFKQRERSLFTMSEHNKYIYKLDNSRLPERNNHHSWPPMITEKNNHWH